MVTDFGVARVAESSYFEHEMTQGPGTEVGPLPCPHRFFSALCLRFAFSPFISTVF